jgi:hypothetical protein
VAAPKQTIGLTNFAFSISKCPPNPDAIRSIVFTKCDNLAVVNGANTEILIPLTNFYVPVDNAARLSFSVPGTTANAPVLLQKMDLGGVGMDDKVKFLTIFPQYGSTESSTQYLEWTSLSSIDDGDLYDKPVSGPSATTGLDTTQVNKLEFSWGGYVDFNGGTGSVGSIWAATNGGLVKWDGTNMTLWNTLNSNSPSDFISSLAVSSYGMYVGTNHGIAKFNETEGFTNIFNASNSPLPNNNVNDIKFMNDGRLAIATDLGLSIYNNTSPSTWITTNIYNTPSLLYNKILNLQVTSDPYIFVGTTGGVFQYDVGASAWGQTYNSSVTPGWSATNNVQCIDIFNGNLYVGTDSGMVVVPYAGGTATTYTTAGGATGGPISDDIESLRYVNYVDNGNKIYMGHDDGFSIYDIENDSWSSANSTTYSWLAGGVSDILPSFLESNLLDETIFFSSDTSGYGLSKLLIEGLVFSVLPGEDDLTNLLLTYPTALTYPYTPTSLYSNHQPFFFIFSKAMNTTSFQNAFFLGEGITGAGGTVSGAWVWDTPSRQATFYPGGLTGTFIDTAVEVTNGGQVIVGPSSYKNVVPGQQVSGSSGLFDANNIVESVELNGSDTIVNISKTTGGEVLVGDIITFTNSTVPLEKSQIYNMKVSYGSVAQDTSYLANTLNINFYTESIIPKLGWKPIGKMLTLSGTEGNYTEGIYLRNPRGASVNVIALVGR